MSIGHLVHILLTVYNAMVHVNSQQDVNKMSDGHRNVVIR